MQWKAAPLAVALVALIGSVTGLHAQPLPPALTLSAAQEVALRLNPDLAASRREAEAAEGAVIQAGARPNPVLGMDLEDQRSSTRTTTFALSQTIELGGKRSARVTAAEKALQLARAQIDSRQVEVRASVTAAFFSALVAQDRVRLAEASLDIARQGTDATGKRVTAGKVSPVEETRARVAEAATRVELAQARSDLQTALLQLQAAIGATYSIVSLDGDALSLPGALSSDALLARVHDAPAVVESRLELQRLNAVAQVESARRTPDVTVSLGSKRAAELGRNQLVLGVSVPLPLFDTNRGNLLEALRRRDKAEDLLRATEQRVRAEASIARERQVTAAAEVRVMSSEVLPNAQFAFDAASKGYELGKFGYLEVLDAQRTLQQARAQYLRALADAHRAAAEIDRLLGSPANVSIVASEAKK
jgi:cobalt-zinc-cadmium efflux system outer membrane protein